MAQPQRKREKPEETTEQFVKRINQEGGKRKGLRLRFVWQKRRH